MKVVINACFGGFSVSKEAAEFMAKRGHKEAKKLLAEYADTLKRFDSYANGKPSKKNDWEYRMFDIKIKYGTRPKFHGFLDCPRHDPDLVAAVESLGKAAEGECAFLKVVEVPDGIDYEISEYDGNEHIAEKHRTWG